MSEQADRTQAEALRIAHQRLEKLGWAYSAADIGRFAADMISALNATPSKPK